ncbi:VolA/Pla-1 family phospholipase [Salinimonas chungwhensis]|uniref:VolA/Pla-1 family phospholipase n=1 Tax=Salinimonas chungwhensis TaxID=265425 RepID=UPI00036FBE08|nr:VolA/Pla-1 family phospholipase [Salinimonas chungwhensis]
MRKLLISSSVAMALGLAGCGGSGDTIEDIEAETPDQTPFSRIVFDPANGNLNTPNDLLMLPGDDGFFDYTLNIPVANPNDFSDPSAALNTLDGWSTQHPFVINVQTPGDAAIDESTLAAGIYIHEATLGLDQSDPDCAAAEIPSSGCKVGDALTFGTDYTLSLVDSDTISVVPLRPLKSAQGYMLIMTTGLKDTSGKAVMGSTTWDLVKQDIDTKPLATPSQLQLQTLVNTYITPLEDAGFSREELTYVSAFTTQSVGQSLDTLKKVGIATYAQRLAGGDPAAGQSLPALQVGDAEGAPNAMEALQLLNDDVLSGAVMQGAESLNETQRAGIMAALDAGSFDSLQTCSGLLATASGQLADAFGPLNDFAQPLAGNLLEEVGALCAAKHYAGNITLPYYLGVPTAENPMAPVNEFWHAACDSGIVLAAVSDETKAAAEPGPNHTVCQQIGLADLRVNGEKLDPARNITRFNPLPAATSAQTLDVQVTVPDPAAAGALGFDISQPESGWPVVMLYHGITSKKEDMLAITGTLSLAGIATVAIDQPLHGSRGFDVDMDGNDDINATSITPVHYMNLGSLPTARDNIRQSIADLLGLRLGMNALSDNTSAQDVKLNIGDVSVMGVSLGAITGGNFAAIANQSMGDELAALDGAYAINVASLESPGGGLAQFLIESPSFGPLIKGILLTESSPEFRGLLEQLYGTTDVEREELTAAVAQFEGALTPEQAAGVQSTLSQFAFAAQTVLDSADPNNYAQTLGENTPVHMMTVVGDGSEENKPDQVIPVNTSLPLSGQNPLARIIGLEQVSSTSTGEPVSGQVRFTEGAHASSLSPDASAAATEEMQREVATYIATDGTVIQITNEDVVAN